MRILQRPNRGRGECEGRVGYCKWSSKPQCSVEDFGQYAPVSGTIEEVNETLNDQPGLLNKSPEEKGGSIFSVCSQIIIAIARLVVQD